MTEAQTFPLSTKEQDEITLNALLGSIDDSVAEFGQADREKSDAEIFTKLTGDYTKVRNQFSDNVEKLYATFDAMAARLGELACNHDHFLQSSLDSYEKQDGREEHSQNHGHDHNHGLATDHDKITEDKTKKKKKKDKQNSRNWLELLLNKKNV